MKKEKALYLRLKISYLTIFDNLFDVTLNYNEW